jgi:hypothetical protein
VRADFEQAGHTMNEINHSLMFRYILRGYVVQMSGNLLSICMYIRSSRDIYSRWLSSRARDYTVPYHSSQAQSPSNHTSC